jgi:hypothetical protein
LTENLDGFADLSRILQGANFIELGSEKLRGKILADCLRLTLDEGVSGGGRGNYVRAYSNAGFESTYSGNGLTSLSRGVRADLTEAGKLCESLTLFRLRTDAEAVATIDDVIKVEVQAVFYDGGRQDDHGTFRLETLYLSRACGPSSIDGDDLNGRVFLPQQDLSVADLPNEREDEGRYCFPED